MALDSAELIAQYHLDAPNLRLQNYTNGRITVLAAKTNPRWVPVLIWQMTVAEMIEWGVAGQTACFNVLLDGNGLPVGSATAQASGLSLRYGWSNETKSAPFEKIWPEPQGNFVMGAGGDYWVEIAGYGVFSDLVSGITLQNPADEADPNGHHVSVIAWQFRSAIDIPPVVMPPVTEVGYATIKRQSIANTLAGIDAQIVSLTEVRREIAGWLK